MKILTVCSGNSKRQDFSLERDKSYVYDQVESLKKRGHEVDVFLIKGKGIRGYLSNLPRLYGQLRSGGYDLVHAHSGLPGMFSTLQWTCPVVITYHGTDINNPRQNWISTASSLRASWGIFVTAALHERMRLTPRSRFSIIPCGTDLTMFVPKDKAEARRHMGLDPERRVVVFASSFKTPVKNALLAQQAVAELRDVTLIELAGYSREQICWLLNAADVLLMTSFREGSPMVIKEAMACNCPIVSTPVGDVASVIGTTGGCYITSYDPAEVRRDVMKAFDFGRRTDGRDRIVQFDSQRIAEQIENVYRRVLGG